MQSVQQLDTNNTLNNPVIIVSKQIMTMGFSILEITLAKAKRLACTHVSSIESEFFNGSLISGNSWSFISLTHVIATQKMAQPFQMVAVLDTILATRTKVRMYLVYPRSLEVHN